LDKEKTGTLSSFNKPTTRTLVLVTTIVVIGIVGCWFLLSPSPKSVPPSTTETEVLELPDSPETPLPEPSKDNTTSPESGTPDANETLAEPKSEEAYNITDAAATTDETEEIVQVTAKEIIQNSGKASVFLKTEESRQAQEWLDQLEAHGTIRVTGILRIEHVEEKETQFTEKKFWVIYISDRVWEDEPPNNADIVIVFRNATEVQRFKDLEMKVGDEITIEGWFMGVEILENSKVVQEATNP